MVYRTLKNYQDSDDNIVYVPPPTIIQSNLRQQSFQRLQPPQPRLVQPAAAAKNPPKKTKASTFGQLVKSIVQSVLGKKPANPIQPIQPVEPIQPAQLVRRAPVGVVVDDLQAPPFTSSFMAPPRHNLNPNASSMMGNSRSTVIVPTFGTSGYEGFGGSANAFRIPSDLPAQALGAVYARYGEYGTCG
jgi:hypothetical protein